MENRPKLESLLENNKISLLKEEIYGKDHENTLSAWYQSPFYLLVIIAGTIFIVEALIMLLLSILPSFSAIVEMLIDSFSLVTLTFPVLYFFLFRPLVLHIAERRHAEEGLERYREHLEELVDKRTVELRKEILERKKSEETIRHTANHDHLTGLPNRFLLLDHINQVLLRGRRQKIAAAVLLFDIDRFKNINDTLGHDAGDELLKGVAERLKSSIRESDTISRLGGDEFAILTQDINRAEYTAKVAERIFSIFREPFNIRGHELFVTASMGISIYPDDGTDAETLLKNADIAMYGAKEEGGSNHMLYTRAMTERVAKRLQLESKLRRAIDKNEFVIYYQPQVNINTGEVIGTEALVRWQEPEKGLILPGEFIPLAEDTGLMAPIGELVLRAACAQNKIWQDRKLKPMSVAVNVSVRQFKQKDFVDKVADILEESGLDPKHLELELTESVLMEDVKSNMEILGELKAMGIRLAIDDFGTGYSSLEYLKRMPIDRLKIAQSFVRDITVDPDDVAIARTIISMGHSLKMEVIAEGVETVEQLNILRRIQCDKIQGFLISKPLPSREVEVYLEKNRRFIMKPGG